MTTKERDKNVNVVLKKVHEQLDEVYPESISQISQALDMLQKKVVREKLLNDNQRVDGRA